MALFYMKTRTDSFVRLHHLLASSLRQAASFCRVCATKQGVTSLQLTTPTNSTPPKYVRCQNAPSCSVSLDVSESQTDRLGLVRESVTSPGLGHVEGQSKTLANISQQSHRNYYLEISQFKWEFNKNNETDLSINGDRNVSVPLLDPQSPSRCNLSAHFASRHNDISGFSDDLIGRELRSCSDASSQPDDSLQPQTVEDSDVIIRPLTNISPDNIVFCLGSAARRMKNISKKPSSKRPNVDELQLIQDHLNDYLPKCFAKKHDYRIYHQDVVFENNFAKDSFVTQGLNAYVNELVKYRVYAHFRYANVRMSVLKSTVHEGDGSVRIRWRISGIPQARAFMFWKFLPWKYSKSVNKESEWMDGLSTFYVQANTGVIYKHRVDKVLPDEDVADIKTVPLNVSGTA